MTTEPTMTLARFARIVAAYGAEARAWPEGERDAALAFCAQNADAQRLRADAAALDTELARSEVPAADRALEERIMADFRGKSQPAIRGSKRWVGLGAIAASLVVGVTAAWFVFLPKPDVDLSDPAAWEVLGEDLEFDAQQEG